MDIILYFVTFWYHYCVRKAFKWCTDVWTVGWRDKYIQAEVWDFSVLMTKRMRWISYLLYTYGLFIKDLSLWSIKTNIWSADNVKNTSHQWAAHLFSRCNQMTLVSRYPFWQLSIDHKMDVHIRIPTIKLNTDCICLGHLANNARSLQENSQSERTYYCSHIIKIINCKL